MRPEHFRSGLRLTCTAEPSPLVGFNEAGAFPLRITRRRTPCCFRAARRFNEAGAFPLRITRIGRSGEDRGALVLQ